MNNPAYQTQDTVEARARIRVIYDHGLAMRVSHSIVKIVQHAPASFRFQFEERIADGDSMLELLALAAPCGSIIEATAAGADANEAMPHFLSQLPRDYFEVVE